MDIRVLPRGSISTAAETTIPRRTEGLAKMPFKDPEKKRAYMRKYRSTHRAQHRKYQRKYAETHPERLRNKRATYREQSRKVALERRKRNPEKCWRCGRPCNPMLYVMSRRGKKLPMCTECAPDWLEGGRMPK